MSSQNNIETDMLWLRRNPDSNAFKPQANQYGQHFFHYGAANADERLEMTYRAVGREYNWELRNYIMSKKPADKGNRRRFLKNAVRFVKNPFGYVYWRLPSSYKKINPFFITIGVSFLFLFEGFRQQVVQKHKETTFLGYKGYKQGGELDVTLPDKELRLGDNHNFLNTLTYYHLNRSQYLINPCYRANFRKYVEHGL